MGVKSEIHALIASLVFNQETPSEPQDFSVSKITESVSLLVENGNDGVAPERRATLKSALIVAERSLVASANRKLETRAFNLVRDVTNFITLSKDGRVGEFAPTNTDLLSIGHPLSTAPHSMGTKELRTARSRWIAADPRISVEYRALVSSAYGSEPNSVEQNFAIARLQALPKGSIPAELIISSTIEALTAGIGDGNSSAARRARVKLQWRDRYGRWVEMGRGTMFKLRMRDGSIKDVRGKFVGGTSSPAFGRVLVRNSGDANIPDAVYLVNSRNGEVFDFELAEGILEKSGIDASKVEKPATITEQLDKDIQNIATIRTLSPNSLDDELAGGSTDEEKATAKELQEKSPIAKLPAGAEAESVPQEALVNFDEKSFAEKVAFNTDVDIPLVDQRFKEFLSKDKNLKNTLDPKKFGKYLSSDSPVSDALSDFDAGTINKQDLVNMFEEGSYETSLGGKNKELSNVLQGLGDYFKKDYDPQDYSDADKSEPIALLPETVPTAPVAEGGILEGFDYDKAKADSSYVDSFLDGFDAGVYAAPEKDISVLTDSQKEAYEAGLSLGDKKNTEALVLAQDEFPRYGQEGFEADSKQALSEAISEISKPFYDELEKQQAESMANEAQATEEDKVVGERFTEWQVPAGAYPLQNQEPYEASGALSDIYGADATDDPKVLASSFDSEILEEALTKSISGDGDSEVDFADAGPVPIPAEALYDALREQGVNADSVVAKAYDAISGKSENQINLKSFREKKPAGQIAKLDAKVIEKSSATELNKFLVKDELAGKAVDLIEAGKTGDGFGDADLQILADSINSIEIPKTQPIDFLERPVGKLLAEYLPWAFSDDESKKQAFRGLLGLVTISDGHEGLVTDKGGVLDKIFKKSEFYDESAQDPTAKLREAIYPDGYTYTDFLKSKSRVAIGEEDGNSPNSFAGATYKLAAKLSKEQTTDSPGGFARGIINPGQEAIDAYTTVGNVVNMDLRPFSGTYNEAAKFAKLSFPSKQPDAIIFTLEGALEGIDTRALSNYSEEAEILASGKYEVVEATKLDGPAGGSKYVDRRVFEVTLKPVDKEQGIDLTKFKTVDKMVSLLQIGDLVPKTFLTSKGAQDAVSEERKKDPNFELPPLEEVVGFKASDGFMEKIVVLKNLKTGETRDFRARGTTVLVDVRVPIDSKLPGDNSPRLLPKEGKPSGEPEFYIANLDDLSMVYDLKDYKQVSGQLGSNKGGIFEDSTGKQIYVKEPKTDLHGDNEVLASALYELAGVPAVKVRNGELADGTKVTFSEMVPNSNADFAQKVNDPEYRKKVQDGFVVDAWLANWDVAGTGFDNIVSDANDEPVRVDPGGALLFRAQGAPKGNAFNDKVTELETLVDPSQNAWSAKTFQDMSEQDKAESAKKLLDISNEDIDNYVNASITDEEARTKLSDILKARRATILNRYSLEEGVKDGGAGQQQPEPGSSAGPEGQGIVPEDVEPQGGGVDGQGDSDGNRPWATLENKLEPHSRTQEIQESGSPTPDIYELDAEKYATDFVKMMEKLKENNKHASSVYIYDLEDYKKMRLFSTADGTAGFGLKPDGDIVSVFVYGDSPHKGTSANLLAQAVELGGNKLDAYDTILPKIYAKAGFRTISRVPWNEDEADSSWDKELYKDFKNGEPDVVAMAYDPTRFGSTYDPTEGEYFDDYNDAMAARDQWIVNNQTPSEPNFSSPTAIDTSEGSNLEEQLQQAIDNGESVSFNYNDKARVVIPKSIWTNPKNGNVNLYAIDEDGNKKNYTVSKIQPSTALEAGEESGFFEEPTGDNVPELSGYTLEQASNGTYYAPNITAEDIYALRNGEKKPSQFPFAVTNDPANGNVLYFDKNGVKRWGQFGASGAVLKRDTNNGSYEVLLVKRSSQNSTDQGFWSVPSGAHNNIEDVNVPGATSKRELTEELGIVLGTSNINSVEVEVSPEDWNFTYDIINVDPAMDLASISTLNKEIEEYTWVNPQQLVQMESEGQLHPAMTEEVVKDVLSMANGTTAKYSGTASAMKAPPRLINSAGKESQLYPEAVLNGKVLRSTNYPNNTMMFGYGTLGSTNHSADTILSTNSDGTVDVSFSDENEQSKTTFSSLDSAKAWLGDKYATKSNSQVNPITNNPVGDGALEESQTIHKGGYAKPATQPQVDSIKKMLDVKDVPEDKKSEIQSSLDKSSFVIGEAGQYISYLKSLPELEPEQASNDSNFVDNTVNPEVVQASLVDPALTPQKGSPFNSADDILDPAKILEALKLSHKDSYELENGDVALYSTTYTTGYGKSYKYELIARRTKKERFFAYVRETDMQTGTVRVFKATKEVHSYKAAMNKLVSAKNGLTSSDPRNWFTKLAKSKVETVLAKNDLSSIADEMLGSKTGSELQGSLEDLVAGLGGQSFNIDKAIIQKLQKNSSNLPAGFVDNVINKMVESKAKEADNISDQILGIADPPPFPHMSYNGQQLSVGDYVDWTDITSGKVHRGKVVHVKYNHDSKGYVYSDQTLVEFTDLTNQRWRVSSNLVKVDKGSPISEPFFAKLEENVEQKLTPILSTTEKPDIDLAKQKAVEDYQKALMAAKLVPSKPDLDLTPAQEAGLSVEMTTPDVEVTPQPNGSVVVGDEASGTYSIVQEDGTTTYYLNDVPVFQSEPKTVDSSTVSAVEEVVATVTASPENTVEPAQLADIVGDAKKATSTLPEQELDSVYGEYGVKILGPDDVVSTGGKKAKFKYLKEVSELKVGDIVRKATGSKKHYYQILEKTSRNQYLVRLITPTTTESWTQKWKAHGKIQTVGISPWYGYKHVYRPTEVTIAEGYFKPKTPKVSPSQDKINTKNLNVTATPQQLAAESVDKKSDESNAYFGITGEISDLPYNELAVSTNATQLWKTGFDSIKVKTADEKYVIPGALVNEKDGDSSGVVISTNKPDSELSVIWNSGSKQSTVETLSSKEVNDTGMWLSPEKAKSLGIFVDEVAIQFGKDSIAQKIKSLEESNATFIESKKKEIEYKKLKAAASVKGTGTQSIKVEKELSWSGSELDKVSSLDTILKTVASNDDKGAYGQEVLIDSGDVEDNKLRVYTAYDSKGNKETRLTYTLTSWATDSNPNDSGEKSEFIQQLSNNSEVTTSSRLQYRRFQRLENKLVENGTWNDGSIDNSSLGTTYTYPLKDNQGQVIGTVRIHRANKDASTPKFLGQSSAPIAYHNKVDISINGDATPEQVQLALQQGGVTESRPATKEDIRVLAENKIIGIFGQKADGSINFEGELRQKILDDVKSSYGIDATDLTPTQDENGEIQFLLPEEFGKKMAEITNTKVFTHSWNSSLPNDAQGKAGFLFKLLSDDGLRATTYRWASGINNSGMSSTSDGYRVGANYIFTRKSSMEASQGGYGLKFHFDASKLLRRLDFYANRSDSFGAKSEKDMLAEMGNDYVYEILFKGTISWADLSMISIDSETRKILLQMLLDSGDAKFGENTAQSILGIDNK